MTYTTRNEATKAIKAALKARTGRDWSVRGDHGTAYGWIHVTAPKARLTCQFESGDPCDGSACGRSHEYGYLTMTDRQILALVFGLHGPAHPQGVSISPDSREWYLAAARGEVAA